MCKCGSRHPKGRTAHFLIMKDYFRIPLYIVAVLTVCLLIAKASMTIVDFLLRFEKEKEAASDDITMASFTGYGTISYVSRTTDEETGITVVEIGVRCDDFGIDKTIRRTFPSEEDAKLWNFSQGDLIPVAVAQVFDSYPELIKQDMAVFLP